jgi:hypothetical protein
MDKGFPIFVSKDESDVLVKIGILNLKSLLLQSAACIIECCENYTIGPEGAVIPQSAPIARILRESTNMAENGFVNALQSHVALLYTFVKEIVASEGKTQIFVLIEQGEITLITKALDAYQKYKTAICKAEQKTHGEHWGTAMEFFKADWTDLNSKFLALFQKPSS